MVRSDAGTEAPEGLTLPERPELPQLPQLPQLFEGPSLNRRAFISATSLSAAGVALSWPATQVLADAPLVADAAHTPADLAAASDASTQPVRLSINGQRYVLQLEARVTLLDALRERIGLMGTKKGCDRGQCGACTVLVNGRRINACLSLAVMHQDDAVTTIEGLANAAELHPMQRAFIEQDAYQCGYCTPGQICSAVAALDEIRAGAPSAVTADVRVPLGAIDAAELRERMSGNLCRCGAYTNIVAALEAVLATST